jgi:cyclic pyranopterin phosphate synthase
MGPRAGVASTIGGVGDLRDTFGRVHRDLRISVTDRCNFRCTYCMPADGLKWLPRSEMLTFEEIERIARVMVERFGIASIRLTGGEPTLRANVDVLIAKLAALGVELSITTNGTMLAQQAEALRRAGLHRVNVSLDSLRPERFAELTRRDDLERVLAGIEAAVAAGFEPVKLNVVAMRGVNDDEVVDFARFGRQHGVVVRFIEFMPLDAEERWSPESVLSQAEILERIGEVFPLEPQQRGNEPAERFRYLDGGGEVGVIPSVTRPFCESCDRVRLTSEGALRNCLFAMNEVDLREVLRNGGTDDDLAEAVAGEVRRKWAGHAIGQSTFVRPRKSMSQIGG